ncbi:MAG: 50S ribosomal protein L25 [Microgenomates group bacterium GW2011_GWF2_45_18]|nr:MAG: 50S ribosomal protein L25 [Microgenomates group bacterium GW2011_GWF1_44_10]KKU01869.1 MAG: 50S ribosomal protein L25 [Microgenomates group bacterium GW2011_GWF2_45_18]OGJ41114.1 MAG: hypothetical protein A2378_04510 [Candidatus Pacebacteria bacterium RIFOXYB1_FULL_44_10]HAU98814.1 50S ribosomal protein L25 [Candidatus Paceibacterota bacterium]HAX01366.1 50S ribosomal protein L25 [Candidatus Paceibacterota bacterium]
MTSSQHRLSVEKRVLLGKKVKQLRSKGLIPANIYGEKGTTAIQVDTKLASKTYAEVGDSGVLYLSVESLKEKPVMFKEVAYDSVTGDLLHISFQEVNLLEEITAQIEIEIVGESPAVKEGAVLLTLRDEVEAKALPTDLPEKFVLSIDTLSEVGQEITVADLPYDRTKVEVLLPETEVLVRIANAEEEVVEEVVPTLEDIEIAAKGKQDEELDADGVKKEEEKAK